MRRRIARLAPALQGGTRVLLYHSIDEPHPADRMALRVSRRNFLDQITRLQTGGYSVVSLASVLESPARNHYRRVAITFDDGYHSLVWVAEVLREFGYRATVFVVPRFLDGGRSPLAYWEQWQYLGWHELDGLVRNGFEIGAHSATHVDLRACGDEQLDEEVAGAKARLEARLGRPVVAFSYPFGRHDSRVRRAVERAGYQLACTSRYGRNRRPSDHYALERTEIAGTDNARDFEWKLRGKYDWLGYWQDAVLRR